MEKFSEELPKGWIETHLKNIVHILDHRRVPINSKEREERKGIYPYYGANGQVGTIDDYIFDGEYILLAEDGGYFDNPLKKVAYQVSGKFWVNNHAHILSPCGGIACPFLTHFLNSIDWMPYVSGTTRLKLTQGKMKEILFRLPPLAEQRRIVARIEALQSRSRKAKEALDAIPSLLEKLRQSILAAACSGKLTENWREKNLDVEHTEKLEKMIEEN